VLSGGTRRHAFRVDALVGQRDVVVKGMGRLLPRLDVLAGASVEPDGSILLVLDALGLIERARLTHVPGERVVAMLEEDLIPKARRGSILVVDDALTVRELQRSILERAGFDIRVACDGVEALALLAEAPADLVLTDVEMPRMDGFALTTAIRARPNLANVPIIVLTSRASEDDRQRGLEAGADGYIVKSAFDESGLLAAVDRLLGRRR
jgi:two-component system chemotaxis sensor kinase CheA